MEPGSGQSSSRGRGAAFSIDRALPAKPGWSNSLSGDAFCTWKPAPPPPQVLTARGGKSRSKGSAVAFSRDFSLNAGVGVSLGAIRPANLTIIGDRPIPNGHAKKGRR
jgi:hypothetical protein